MKQCLFCAADDLTREHLISRPIAGAFGIDRNAENFARFAPGENDRMSIQALNNLQVRLVCGTCNAGWMNDLEHDMAAVGRWLQSARCGRLGKRRFDTIRAWLLKTYLVLSAIEGGITKFSDDGEPRFRVIPELTRARQLRAGDLSEAFEGVHCGFARTGEMARFGYSFGNPTIEPVGPRYAGVRSAGAAALAFGGVQLWIVVPFIPGATCEFPSGVEVLTQHADVKRVRHIAFMPDQHQAIVDNGEHDIVALSANLTTWAAARAS